MWKKVFTLSVVCVFVSGLGSVGEQRPTEQGDLEQRADQPYRESIERGRLGQSDEFQEVRERVRMLRAMAREAEERARGLWIEANELERALDRAFGHREMPRPAEPMHERLVELEEAAERAEREGRHDDAARLREEVRQLAMELEEMARQREAHDLAGQIERLNAAAKDAEQAGRHDEAAAIFREAEELEHRLSDIVEGTKQGLHENNLENQIDTLRDEVGRLRSDIEELKQIVRNKATNL